MILGATPLPRGRAPFNFDHTAFPSLESWFRFEEATGTALADKTGNVTGMTLSGTGSHWAVPRCATFATATTDRAATAVTNINSTNMPAPVAGDVVLLEADLYVVGTNAGYVMEIGRTVTGSVSGYGGLMLSVDYSSGVRVNVGVRNTAWTTASSLQTSTTFRNLAKFTSDTRAHLLAVIDFTDPAYRYIGVTVYINGVQVATEQLDSDSLGGYATGNFRAQGDFRFGHLSSSPALYFTGRLYNARYWRMSSVRDDMADIAVQMARNPSELPPLLEGV